ncbi:MAG: tetratricopeptide repeat protein [Endomicrobium sp.]|nr:tetratricopeptide repeat protein [Endomicrobium sp.]
MDIYSRSASVKKGNETAASLEIRAEQLADDGQYYLAAHIYEELLSQGQSKKKTFAYNIKLGDLAELSGDYGLSLDYYRKAESLYKKNIDAKYKIGDILLKSNLYTLSESAFLSALDIDKNSNYAKMRLGDIYFLQSLYQKALERYLAIDAYYYNEKIISNTAQCLRSVGKTDDALQIANNFLISNESPQIYFLSAILYSDKKMYKEAEEQFLKVISMDSLNFASFVYLAGIYLNNGKLKEAKENLDKAYKIDSSYCAIDLLYAQIAYKEGKLYEARRYAHNAYMKARSDFTKIQSQKMLDFLTADNR